MSWDSSMALSLLQGIPKGHGSSQCTGLPGQELEINLAHNLASPCTSGSFCPPYPLWEADSPDQARRRTPAPCESSLVHPGSFRKGLATPTQWEPLLTRPQTPHHLPRSKGCSRIQKTLGRWHRWWHKVTQGLKPKVGGWVGS